MKKYLIILAAACVALASCTKKEEKSALKGISFKESEITMTMGDTVRLALVPEPKEIALPTDLVWESSDEKVAQVIDNKGNVTALNVGTANITAKSGDLKAVCAITVKSVLGAYQIEDYGIFGQAAQSFVEGSDTTFNLSWAGGEMHCRIGYWPMIAWDGDLTYVSGTGFVGKGFMLYAKIPFYTVDDEAAGDYNGYPFGWGSFRIMDTKGIVKNNYGQAGSVNKDIWCEYMDSYVTELINDGDGSNIKWELFNEAVDMDGAMLWIADYSDANNPVWYVDNYGLVHGLVKDMLLLWDGDTESFSYKADIDWFDFLSDNTFYGLLLNEDDSAVKPYELRMISEHYSTMEEEEAPASFEPQLINKRYMEMPVLPKFGQKVATDKLYKK